jgi:hypothetical protein
LPLRRRRFAAVLRVPPVVAIRAPVAPQAEIVTAAAVSSASRTLPAAEPSKRRNANLPPS